MWAWCQYTPGRFERTHGDALDAYTPSSSLHTQDPMQQHTTTEHSTTKDNRQLTTTSTRGEAKHQPPAAHLSEHETQAKKPTQYRQPKQPTNTSTREHERRDTSPEPGDNRNTTEKHETCDQSQDKTRRDKTSQEKCTYVHILFDECVLGVRANVITTNELKRKGYHKEQSSLSTTSGHSIRAVVNVHVVNSDG